MKKTTAVSGDIWWIQQRQYTMCLRREGSLIDVGIVADYLSIELSALL